MPPAAYFNREVEPERETRNDHEAFWRQATQKGVEAFSEGDFDKAGDCFGDALFHASQLFMLAAANVFSPRDAAHIMIVSQHNIADNFVRRGMLEEAYTHYLTVFSTFCDWLESSQASRAMRHACADKINDAEEAVVAYLRRINANPEAIAAIYARASKHNAAMACGLH